MASSFDTAVEMPTFGTVAKFAENVVFRVPGCSDLMVRKAVRWAYNDFCRRSCCLRTVRRLSIEEEQTDYPVMPVYGQSVDSIVRVSIGRRVLRPQKDYLVVDGLAKVVRLHERFVPWSGEAGGVVWMEVEAVEMPSLESEEMPSWFADKYGAAVVSGALAQLLGTSGRAWSDPQSAAVERRAYENAVAEAKLAGMTGGNFGGMQADNPLASELL